jgi:hypothetical protein
MRDSRFNVSLIRDAGPTNEAHAGHVEMNHYFGAKDSAAKMGEMLGGMARSPSSTRRPAS